MQSNGAQMSAVGNPTKLKRNSAMKIVAKISKNYRDTKTSSPKVLLRINQVQSDTFDRDHTFVPLTANLKKVLQTIRGNASILIEFEADEALYTDHRKSIQGISSNKQTLTNIRNVRIIGRV